MEKFNENIGLVIHTIKVKNISNQLNLENYKILENLINENNDLFDLSLKDLNLENLESY
jgi:hypothetical protein